MEYITTIDTKRIKADHVRRRFVRLTPILLTPGKHANDKAFSFYMKTRSGWFCEYGYGGAVPEEQSEIDVRDIWGMNCSPNPWDDRPFFEKHVD